MEIDPNIRMGLLIKMVDNAFGSYLNNQSVDLGLTAAQCQVLGFIAHSVNTMEVNPIHIEQKFRLKRPTVTGILQRLEKNGFITLSPSKKDGRYKQINLTDKARAHHELMNRNVDDAEARLIQNISDEDIRLIRRLLAHMIENLSGEN